MLVIYFFKWNNKTVQDRMKKSSFHIRHIFTDILGVFLKILYVNAAYWYKDKVYWNDLVS